jgi:hypothetical protein
MRVSQWSGVNWLVSELEDRCGSVRVSCCYEKLIAEARDSSGIQRKNVRRWKPLPGDEKTQQAEKT